METKKFIELAKNEVVKYHNAHQDPVIFIDEKFVYVVWSCKTLQNHKALLGVAKPDGDMYYEVTYNGDRGEMYFDAYKKEKHICISVENPKCESAPDETETMENFNPLAAHYDLCRKTRQEARETMGISLYACTVDGMLSPDYKERFKAEYQQTKIRYEKLKAFCNRIEAAMRTCPGDTKRVAMPEHDCPLELLRDQQRAMGEYLHCLEIRAVIEGIEL